MVFYIGVIGVILHLVSLCFGSWIGNKRSLINIIYSSSSKVPFIKILQCYYEDQIRHGAVSGNQQDAVPRPKKPTQNAQFSAIPSMQIKCLAVRHSM